jgi:hypothetical protein
MLTIIPPDKSLTISGHDVALDLSLCAQTARYQSGITHGVTSVD